MPAPHDTREARQEHILRLLERAPIKSQTALQQALRDVGVDANQATLSRDLRDLGVVKTRHGYELPPAAASDASPHHLRLALRTWLLSARAAQNLIVLRTPPGGAQPLALALDREGLDDVLGTVAGDDTVFIACPNDRRAKALCRRLLPPKAAARS